jgi:hypothetical protein
MATPTVETAIVKHLRDTVGVSAVVGTKVYRVIAPQGTAAPFVVVSCISEDVTPLAGADMSLRSASVQVDCYAASNAAVLALAAEAKEALSRKSGTWDGVVVQQCFFDGTMDDFEVDTLLYRRTTDLTVWYEEPAHV